MKENWLCENNVVSILYHVEYFRHKLTRACEIEHDNLKQSQDKMKHWYEMDPMIREFKSGEKVIVLLLIGCHPLQAKYCWPYVIESRVIDLNYILNTHTKRKKRQICLVIKQGFSKEYSISVDASDVGVGAVLLQEGKDDIDVPNCYFFFKH